MRRRTDLPPPPPPPVSKQFAYPLPSLPRSELGWEKLIFSFVLVSVVRSRGMVGPRTHALGGAAQRLLDTLIRSVGSFTDGVRTYKSFWNVGVSRWVQKPKRRAGGGGEGAQKNSASFFLLGGQQAAGGVHRASGFSSGLAGGGKAARTGAIGGW